MKTPPTSKVDQSAVVLHPVVSRHLRELHEFVDHIMRYAEEPGNWPLTQQEQIAFVRTVIYQARKLRKSEGYVTTAVILAAEALAMTA